MPFMLAIYYSSFTTEEKDCPQVEGFASANLSPITASTRDAPPQPQATPALP
jgi:hypothetical protein